MPNRNQWIGVVLAACLPLGCGEEPASSGEAGEDTEAGDSCSELTAVIDTDVSEGGLPLTVSFDSEGSCTPEEIVESWWSFGVGAQAASGRQASFTYLGSGSYTVTLTLTDTAGHAHATTTQASRGYRHARLGASSSC